MRRRDYAKIAESICRASQCECGRTAQINALGEMAEEIAEALAGEPHFNKAQFIKACGLELPSVLSVAP